MIYHNFLKFWRQIRVIWRPTFQDTSLKFVVTCSKKTKRIIFQFIHWKNCKKWHIQQRFSKVSISRLWEKTPGNDSPCGFQQRFFFTKSRFVLGVLYFFGIWFFFQICLTLWNSAAQTSNLTFELEYKLHNQEWVKFCLSEMKLSMFSERKWSTVVHLRSLVSFAG